MTQQPIFVSPIMQQLLRMVDRVAKSKASVLLIGETGSGKEVISATIHQRSLRVDKPLIELNCGAIPDHLVESELFGAEKGAFTGADHSKPGFFELANGGTLFLDEIGDLNLAVQSKLLRVLDGTPYFRLGGSRKIESDVRVIAATNRDLRQAVEEGSFRRDLFHRLAQFQINVPPLRSRPEDVVALAERWLAEHKPDGRFTAAAMRSLATYDWPGNVRELRNVVLRAAMLIDGDVIDVDDLEINAKSHQAVAAAAAAANSSALAFEPGRTLESIERNAIFSALEGCGGNQGKAADKLGISRRTLVRKLKQYRSTEAQPIGYMSPEQQQYFRAQFETVVSILHDGAEYNSKLRNVSGSGLSVRELSISLPTEANVTVRFKLADEDEMTMPARVVWMRPSGEAGLAWVEQIPRALSAWLLRQQTGEGWSVSHADIAARSYAAQSSQ